MRSKSIENTHIINKMLPVAPIHAIGAGRSPNAEAIGDGREKGSRQRDSGGKYGYSSDVHAGSTIGLSVSAIIIAITRAARSELADSATRFSALHYNHYNDERAS
jgi:hypothetical protein